MGHISRSVPSGSEQDGRAARNDLRPHSQHNLAPIAGAIRIRQWLRGVRAGCPGSLLGPDAWRPLLYHCESRVTTAAIWSPGRLGRSRRGRLGRRLSYDVPSQDRTTAYVSSHLLDSALRADRIPLPKS